MKRFSRFVFLLVLSVLLSTRVLGVERVTLLPEKMSQGSPIHLLVGESKSFITMQLAGQKWISKNAKIASVSNGIVTGRKKGTTTIAHYNGRQWTAYKVTVYSNAKKRYFAEMKPYLKGKWGRNSSEYRNKYYKFDENYIKAYDKKTKKLISKGKITSISREKVSLDYRYHMVIEGNTKLVFYFKNRRFEDAWYYFKQNGQWKYSASGSFTHLTYK